jgi:hypothetical protein
MPEVRPSGHRNIEQEPYNKVHAGTWDLTLCLVFCRDGSGCRLPGVLCLLSVIGLLAMIHWGWGVLLTQLIMYLVNMIYLIHYVY